MTTTYTDQTSTDGDFDDEPTAAAGSGLAALKADVDAAVSKPTLLQHPTMSAYVLEFRTDVDAKDIQKWTDIAGKGRKVPDRRLQFGLTIAGTNLRILKDGEALTNSAGQPTNFRDKDLMEMLGVTTAAAAAIRFIKGDGHLASLANAVLAAAGYGEDAETVDPTELASPED